MEIVLSTQRNLYDVMYYENINFGSTYKWIDYIKYILISTGKPNLFHQAFINNLHVTKVKIGKTLHDLFIQDWAAKLDTPNKSRNYGMFKQTTDFEPFLTILPRCFISIQLNSELRTINSLSKRVAGKISVIRRGNVLCVTKMILMMSTTIY